MPPEAGKSTMASRPKRMEAARRARMTAFARPRLTNSADRRAEDPSLFTTWPLSGDLPPFNDWASMAVDHEAQKIYMYGGCRPGDDNCNTTSDFHCCDMQNMKWKRYTRSLRFMSHPFDPYSNRSKKRPLPARLSAACTFLPLNGKRFIYIFGGYSEEEEETPPPSQLLAVDLDEETWWFAPVEGDSVADRMDCSLVGIGNRLYIFGGRQLSSDDNSPPIASFCVAEYNSDQGKWIWRVRDQPYPSHIPALGFGGSASPVYGGKKILLTKGRLHVDGHITLSPETTILFHTTHYTFQVQSDTTGNFPTKDVAWYALHALGPPTDSSSSKPEQPKQSTPRKRPSNNSPARHIAASKTLGSTPVTYPPSAIMAGWVSYNEHFLTPELWMYLLPPEEEFRCLNLRRKIWDLALDLQLFVVVGSRAFLVGFQTLGQLSFARRGGDSDDDSDDDDSSDSDDNKEKKMVWNVCVEISLDHPSIRAAR